MFLCILFWNIQHQSNGLSGWNSSPPCKWCGFNSPLTHGSVIRYGPPRLLLGSPGQLDILKIVGIKGLSGSSGGSTIGIKSPWLQPLERVHLLIEAIVCGQHASTIHASVCNSCLKVVWRFERRTVYISSLRVRTIWCARRC